jgi:hypothetical protein
VPSSPIAGCLAELLERVREHEQRTVAIGLELEAQDVAAPLQLEQ